MKETVEGLNVFDLKISTVRILHFLVVLGALKFVFNIEVHMIVSLWIINT